MRRVCTDKRAAVCGVRANLSTSPSNTEYNEYKLDIIPDERQHAEREGNASRHSDENPP